MFMVYSIQFSMPLVEEDVYLMDGVVGFVKLKELKSCQKRKDLYSLIQNKYFNIVYLPQASKLR